MPRTPSLLLLLALPLSCIPHAEVPLQSLARTPDGTLLPPAAEQRPYMHEEHGVERPDPYYWMRDRQDPATLAYLQAENTYTEAMTAHLAGLRQTLFDEMLAHIQEADTSVPLKKGDWWYYSRTEEGQSYRVHCRRPVVAAGEPEGAERLLLDENTLAEGLDYFDLGLLEPSPDHHLLAWASDTSGSERYTLRFLDLESNQPLPDAIENTAPSLAWASDAHTVFYVTLDEAYRPWQLHRHTLGADPAEDTLVYQEDDDRYFLDVGTSRSEQYILMALQSAITSEIRILEADNPEGEFRIFQPRHEGMEYSIAHHGDRFYVLTNDSDDEQGQHDQGAVNFKLMSAPLHSTSRQQWEEVIPHRPQVLLDDIDAFSNHLVLSEREQGRPQIRVFEPSTGAQHVIQWPEPSHTVYTYANLEYDTQEVLLAYTSLVSPNAVYAFDLVSHERRLLKEKPVPGYDRARYQAERLFATAPDGTQVPISLVYRRDLDRTQPQPLFLTGYGAYGDPYDPWFMSSILPILDRGMVYAIAQVRGGGELGRPWYEDGKLTNKRNTFSDFIACAEHLHANGWTSPALLAIESASAGGLLIGTVINERPELFAAAVAQVPFVDLVTTMMDESIPLTATEWEEWGDPRQRADFDYMLAYSPYDNVKAQAYPDLLITAGLNDPRVMYWEPAKWTARLRATATGDGLILLKTEMGAGHGGKSGRYGYLEDEAYIYAFVMDRLAIDTDLGRASP